MFYLFSFCARSDGPRRWTDLGRDEAPAPKPSLSSVCVGSLAGQRFRLVGGASYLRRDTLVIRGETVWLTFQPSCPLALGRVAAVPGQINTSTPKTMIFGSETFTTSNFCTRVCCLWLLAGSVSSYFFSEPFERSNVSRLCRVWRGER